MAGAVQKTVDAAVVYFDLETSDKWTLTSEIVQLSAKSNKKTFNIYIQPQGEIHPEASKVNGFSKQNGKLLKHGVAVDFVGLEDALEGFLHFLKDIDEQVILVAHNGNQFDAPILLRDLRQNGLIDSFLEVVCGFTDTVHLFTRKLPRWRLHRLVDLARLYGVDAANAHDGAEDVRILADVVLRAGITDDDIRFWSKTVSQTVLGGVTKFGKRYGLELLRRSISEDMLRLLAEHVISIEMLQLKASDDIAFAKLVDFFHHSDVNSDRIEKLKGAVLMSTQRYRN